MITRIKIEKAEIEKLIQQGLNKQQIASNLNICVGTLNARLKEYELVVVTNRTCSPEHKATLSEKRKKWLQENPDRHPWRLKKKFQSEPAEKVKSFLNSLEIPFIEEYPPEIKDRFFSIDIALPDKMIALEINGNQHYERNGKLKPYYRERHDLLEAAGWAVYEIHYSACFNLRAWEEFFLLIHNSNKKVNFDYFNYRKPARRISDKYNCQCGQAKSFQAKLCKTCYGQNLIKKTKQHRPQTGASLKVDYRKNLCFCGCLKTDKSIMCRQCNHKNRIGMKRKCIWPSKEELQRLIITLPMTQIGKRFGVSDNAVRKWCRFYNISKVALPAEVESAT